MIKMSKPKIAIHGAAGRMGKRLIALGQADSELDIVAALDAPNHPALGSDSGELAGIGTIGIPLSSTIPAGTPVDVIIDFSTPAALDPLLDLCLTNGYGLVFATTGADESQLAKIRDV